MLPQIYATLYFTIHNNYSCALLQKDSVRKIGKRKLHYLNLTKRVYFWEHGQLLVQFGPK